MWCLWKDRHTFKAKELSMPLLKFLYLKIIYKCTPNLIQAFFDSLLSLELVKWKPLLPLSRTLLFRRGPSTFFGKIGLDACFSSFVCLIFALFWILLVLACPILYICIYMLRTKAVHMLEMYTCILGSLIGLDACFSSFVCIILALFWILLVLACPILYMCVYIYICCVQRQFICLTTMTFMYIYVVPVCV